MMPKTNLNGKNFDSWNYIDTFAIVFGRIEYPAGIHLNIINQSFKQ